MTETALADLYRGYIFCLNRQDWPNLHRFVADDARHNGRPFGLAGYRAMLERDFEEIPDLKFNIELMVCEPPLVASRLRFDCRPKGLFLGLPVNGKRVIVRRERLLPISRRQDRGGLVGDRQGGDRGSALRKAIVIARSVGDEAIHPPAVRVAAPWMDCFASLAMTALTAARTAARCRRA